MEIAKFVNENKVIRRASLAVMLTMTVLIFKWATIFASESQKPGIEIAAIIAAILAPLSTLQGFVFKFYNDSRSQEENNG